MSLEKTNAFLKTKISKLLQRKNHPQDLESMDCVVPKEYEMALQALRRGRDLVLKLRDLSNDQPSSVDGWLVLARKLVEEVLVALNSPMTVLGPATAKVAGQDKMVPVNGWISCPVTLTPDGSRHHNLSWGGKRDRASQICEQIGGRRKRDRQFGWIWTRKEFDDDGFTWKKYGQKNIHGAKHKRMYYKCAQSADQGCQATKQVQMTNDDPSLFAVNYIGQHTCQKVIYAPDFMFDDGSTSKRHIIINFGSSCRPCSSTNSSLDSSWPKREETHENLPFPDTNISGKNSTSSSCDTTIIITRSHAELRDQPDSMDLQSSTSCRTSGTDFTDDFGDFVDELLLPEQDWSLP